MIRPRSTIKRIGGPTFKQATIAGAKAAQLASDRAIKLYRNLSYQTEEDITAGLMAKLDDYLNGDIEGLHWSFSVLKRSRGSGSQEKKFGADILMHITMDTPTQTYSKGVLIQAKRKEQGVHLWETEHSNLVDQCNKMLNITPASFVFNYEKVGIRCGSATRVAGDVTGDLHECCDWTIYRFFREFFRCPIGDPRISSNDVEELNVLFFAKIRVFGQLSRE